jgi:phage terminase large subunit
MENKETEVIQFNGKIMDWLEEHKQPTVVSYGGAGSGKTYSLCQHLLFNKLFREKGRNILIARRTNPSLKRTNYKLFMDMLAQASQAYGVSFHHLKNEQLVKCNNNYVFFQSLDDPEKIKSAEYSYAWVEEATEIDKDTYLQIQLRMRQKNPYDKNQIFLTFNPVGIHNWVYPTFFDPPAQPEDVAILHTTYKDNPFLDEEYKKQIENMANQSRKYYEVYALGKFASLSEGIYDNYEIIKDEDLPPDKAFDFIVYGLDFGFNHPLALIKVGRYKGAYYILDEFYKSKITNSDFIKRLKHLDVGRSLIFADREPARVEDIRRAGYNVHLADKNVLDGIDFVQSQRLYIAEHCVNVRKEIASYSWKKDSDGHILDEPVKLGDDAMDAIRYAIYTHHKRFGMKGKLRRIKIGRRFF